MTPPLRVRRAAGADLALLLPLCVEHADFERLPCAAPGRGDTLVAALAAVPPKLHAWVAEAGAQAVGYASATLDFATLDAAHFLHLDCLYVRQAWRGQGVGLRLWQAARDFGAHEGCATMQWQTPAWNADAARFYRRLGAIERRKRRYVLPLAAD